MLKTISKALMGRFMIYIDKCAMLQEDVERAPNGTAFVVSDHRICSAVCKAVPELDEYADYPDVAMLTAKCTGSSEIARITSLTSILQATDATWRQCEAHPMKPGPTCPDRSMAGHDCGIGWQPQCEAAGCCWDKPKKPVPGGRSWCYKPGGSGECEKKCPDFHFQPNKRSDCAAFIILERFTNPDPAVRGAACAEVGCCWQPLEHNSLHPWCFHVPCI
jgi:hypothetical protein